MKKIKYLLISSALFAMSCVQKAEKLPIYGAKTVVEHKDSLGKVTLDSVTKKIPDFGFINQDSVLVTQDHFKGKIYIADFFFTSCSTICPVMHRNLKSIYDELKDNKNICFLSHSIDFKYDTPKKLKSYSEKLGVNDQRWEFVRGSKDSIYNMATKDYLVAVGEDSKAKDGYIHEGYLILVDTKRQIRGAYDGTNSEQVAKLKKDIVTLEKEEFPNDAKK